MKFNRTTKSALFTSVVSLFLCFAMLLGTTFAWFTDSATSAGNKIVAGELNVDLLLYKNGAYTSIKENSEPIFGAAGLAQNDLNTLWEPGKTQVAYLAIENIGTLDLAYKVNLAVTAYTKDLYKAMEYMIVPDATADAPVVADDIDWNNGIAVVPGVNTTEAEKVTLTKDATHYFALVIHMNEDAGNEYQGGEITFDINVLATQINTEAGSLGSDYDKDATFPDYGVGTAVVDGSPVYEIEARKEQDTVNDTKVGYAKVPAAALTDNAESVGFTIVRQQSVDGNVTVADDENAVTYDVTVTNVKEGNTELITVALRVGAGLTGVRLFHKDVEIFDFIYSGEYIEFKTTSFSPFTVIFDEVPVAEEPADPNTEVPVAIVTDADNFEKVALDWTGYGGYNPTAGDDQQLDSVYLFQSPHTIQTVKDSAYKDWYCDYYVKFVPAVGSEMETLPANSIVLGGNYGGYGWVGFDNPTVNTNEWIPLLGAVLGDYQETGDMVDEYWTYERVVGQVEKFWCGVAVSDANNNPDALNGGKFVVELRLTNPNDYNDYIAVNTVTYTFGTGDSQIVNYTK